MLPVQKCGLHGTKNSGNSCVDETTKNCQSFEKNTTNTGLKTFIFVLILNALKMILCNAKEVTRSQKRDEDGQIASNHGVVQNNIDQIYVLHIKYVRTAWMKM